MRTLTEDERWLLLTIKNLEDKKSETPGNWPIHKNIWRGCYDVWFSEQDTIDAVEIPAARMKAAYESGLILSEEKTYKSQYNHKSYDFTVWHLTELGLKLLEKS